MPKSVNPYAEAGKVIVPVVIGGAVVYFLGRGLGLWGRLKPDTTNVIIKKVDLPTGGEGIPPIGVDSKGDPIPWNPIPMAKELADAMTGVFLPTASALIKFNNLPTDDMFTAVNVAFNQMYKDRGSGTLRDWIRDEWMCIGCPRDSIYSRMDRLGII